MSASGNSDPGVTATMLIGKAGVLQQAQRGWRQNAPEHEQLSGRHLLQGAGRHTQALS